jgi:hypothetical protein
MDFRILQSVSLTKIRSLSISAAVSGAHLWLLHWQRHRRIAKLLRVRDGGADMNAHGYDNETPLHYAASHGNLELVSELILDYGADVNVRNVNNWTPLHYACQGFRHPLANLMSLDRSLRSPDCCSSVVQTWMHRPTAAQSHYT